MLIAHPNLLERSAMRVVLDTSERVRVVALTGDGGQALSLAHQLQPTVTLLDDRVPAPHGADLVDALAQRSLLVVLTHATERRVLSMMLRAPIRGCLVYDNFEPTDLLGAVHAVAAGLGWLSPTAAAAATWSLRESAVRARAPDVDGSPRLPAGRHDRDSSTPLRTPRAARNA
ncbi:hypothetical protein [Dactylosporangium sp. CA-233914]|uniref:hypothetical protein n=1 Tax=Dactylosporangium sp. CA-233914 TaxID=3239934 RepID=UPI003D914A62